MSALFVAAHVRDGRIAQAVLDVRTQPEAEFFGSYAWCLWRSEMWQCESEDRTRASKARAILDLFPFYDSGALRE